ncbi:MAG: AEC family transporter [Chloroflexota bacterium]|nr:AEC family transporter [Dehalococcoidia bacterium]MDW8255051.1 AEC family transporter [Chloroflexota bacterium]
MLTVFVNVVLPVFVIVASAYLLGRWRKISPAPLSQVVFYLFSPALAFSGLTGGTLAVDEAAQIALFTLALAAVMLALGWVAARLLRLDGPHTSAFLLTSVFMNAGNLGLSIALFAFGEAGLQRAVVFFVVHSLLSGTLAVFLASRGVGSTRQALLSILRTPVSYAGVAGVAVLVWSLPVPLVVERAAGLLGAAAVPGMLAVLGLQLADIRGGAQVREIAVATVMRLVVGTGAALVLVHLFDLQGVTRAVMILQAAMPTAVFTVILASEFRAAPRFVTGVVLATTLGAIVTITLLATWLGVG